MNQHLLVCCLFLLSSLTVAQVADARQAASAPELKRTVAIARFSNETASGTTFLVDDSGDRLGKQASDILSARLTSTGRFIMFERSDADELSTERLLAGLEEDGIAVDYLITGSVSEFGRSAESERGLFSSSKIQRAYAKVNVRLIEVSTGRIVYSEEGAGEATAEAKQTLGVGGSAAFDQSLTDKAISAAISSLVDSLVNNLSAAPWKSYVLAQDGGSYIIAGGASQGIQAGQSFAVFEKGRTVTNPQTGVNIELPGRQIAAVVVEATFGTDPLNEISYVAVTEGAIGENLEAYYVSQEDE